MYFGLVCASFSGSILSGPFLLMPLIVIYIYITGVNFNENGHKGFRRRSVTVDGMPTTCTPLCFICITCIRSQWVVKQIQVSKSFCVM